MPTTLFTAWYDEVVPEMVGSPPLALVLNAIRNAAIEFCDRAWVWRIDQGPMAIAPGASTYDWEPPANTVVCRPLQVWIDKRRLEAKGAGELSELYGDFMQMDGAPRYFVQDRPDQLIIVPRPASMLPYGGGITAKVAIKPKRTATGLDSFIHERYLDAITHGAKFRLFIMRKKPWTDTGAAADQKTLFDAAVNKAKLDAEKGFAGARMRVKPQFF